MAREAADSALASGDLAALADATVQLELAGPGRITQIGSTPQEPPPQVGRVQQDLASPGCR